MKTKGFTLIELLAVIVILAIIALIAVPIILDIIGDSKGQGNKRSIDMYARTVEQALLMYEIKEGKKATSIEEIEKYVKYDGNRVECETTEIYKNGTIYLNECKVAGENVEYTYGIKMKYENGEAVYFNVTTGKKCNASEAKSDDELNSGCMKFYAFNDSEDSSTVNLLLDHNTTMTVAWISQEDYNDDDNWSNNKTNKGPLTLLNQLKEDTKDWSGTEKPTNYAYDSDKYNDNYHVNYTIDYSKYGNKARLITGEEIAQITGYEEWNNGNYYFDTNLSMTSSETCKYGNVTGCKYGWLYDRTYALCTDYGCLNNSAHSDSYGYWTATTIPRDALSVYLDARLFQITPNINNNSGVRPVIEVSKSKLS